jgi:adenylate kinase
MNFSITWIENFPPNKFPSKNAVYGIIWMKTYEVNLMKKMIFIGGIHGVGKSSTCIRYSIDHNMVYYSASRLISDSKREYFSSNKMIDQIKENQEFLLTAVKSLNLDGEWFFLDGHFCLINLDGAITKVPTETFIQLSPKAIIVITDTVENISLRLKQRDNTKYGVSFLELFQEEEINCSREIAKKLKVSHIIFKKYDSADNFHRFIEKITNE